MFVILTGDHPRHKFLVNSFCKIFKEITWIIQKREQIIPEINKDLSIEFQKLEKIHFEKRKKAEDEFFINNVDYNIDNSVKEIIKINQEDLFNGKLNIILDSKKIELFISYGCSKIPNKVLDKISGYKWNVHGGLSPWYRGAITHFWPSYMLEPEYTGMTLHELTSNIDGGNVIHQSISELNPDDGIHQNACRVVRSFSNELPTLIHHNFKRNKKINAIKQISTGRIWTKKMWSPLNLKLIYHFYDDKINKYCLENKKIFKPKIETVLA